MDTIIDRPQGVNMPVAHITLADVSFRLHHLIILVIV